MTTPFIPTEFHKFCGECKQWKFIHRFGRAPKGYIYHPCRDCRAIRAKQWRWANPEKAAAIASRHQKSHKETQCRGTETLCRGSRTLSPGTARPGEATERECVMKPADWFLLIMLALLALCGGQHVITSIGTLDPILEVRQ